MCICAHFEDRLGCMQTAMKVIIGGRAGPKSCRDRSVVLICLLRKNWLGLYPESLGVASYSIRDLVGSCGFSPLTLHLYAAYPYHQ
ncbi:DNA ligase [Frankliniella fusca]|uniref:DNA ligase n=1 Tax=Frankliniella fusca TaxID=407009 RepID=A0AAE1HER3_9NEOP|nr:DNA ligase [Frankliniella fusca]